jgi:carbonic anhydrase
MANWIVSGGKPCENGTLLAVHGWIYGLNDGLFKDLNLCITGADEIDSLYRMAVAESPGG